eukprot:gene32578-40204_t
MGGTYITLSARDLAEDTTFQLFIVACYGLVLAFVFLGYGLYRTSDHLMKRYGGPLPSFVHIPVLLSSAGWLFSNPFLPNIVLTSLVAFWDSGSPFGISWLGKAYFGLSVTASYALTWMFGLFKQDTPSWHVMHYPVKLVGLILLSSSTSSTELSLVLVGLGLFPDHISHYLWTLNLFTATFNAKPSYKYLEGGKKMSPTALAELSASHTAKHLAALKSHLRQNPSVLNNMTD